MPRDTHRISMIPKTSVRSVLLGLFLIANPALATEASKDQNWPQFRGPDAMGVVEGHPTPTRWDMASGTNIGWKTAIPGLSHSSPVIWGDRLFVTTAVRHEGDSELKVGLYGSATPTADEGVHSFQTYCLDKDTGIVRWVRTAITRVPTFLRHPKGSHAASSPVTDGQHVLAHFASEGLYCYTIEGDLLWSKDLGKLDSGWYVAKDAEFGFSSSPVIYQDMVILQIDIQENSSICALDINDGSVVWTTPRDEVPTWSTPTVFADGAHAQVIVNGYKHMGGYDIETGEELWKMSGGGDVPVPTPIVAEDTIFITNGHGRWNPIYAVDIAAQGLIENGFKPADEPFLKWSQKRRGTYMQTLLYYRDYLYACTDAGVLTCIQPQTGEHLKRERLGSGGSGFTASPIASDGKIYFTSEEGEIFVLKAGPDFEEIAINPMGEKCMATPAISEGTIFVRTQGHVVAIQGDAEVSPEAIAKAAEAKEEEEAVAEAEPGHTSNRVEGGDLPAAETLFSRHLEARGGIAMLQAHPSRHLRGTFQMPSIGLKGTVETKRLAPSFYWNETKIPAMGDTLQGYNGETGWLISPNAGNQIMQGEALEGLIAEASLMKDAEYATNFSEMTTLATLDFADRRCYEVMTKTKSGVEAIYYFDVEGGLLRGTQTEADTGVGVYLSVTTFREYKDFDGLLIAVETHVDLPDHDIQQLLTIDSVEYGTIERSDFELPQVIAELLDKGE